jgi:uncharacterized protein YfkK (UPF0435 family)
MRFTHIDVVKNSIKDMSNTEATKLVYQWVKQNKLSPSQMYELMEYIIKK